MSDPPQPPGQNRHAYFPLMNNRHQPLITFRLKVLDKNKQEFMHPSLCSSLQCAISMPKITIAKRPSAVYAFFNYPVSGRCPEYRQGIDMVQNNTIWQICTILGMVLFQSLPPLGRQLNGNNLICLESPCLDVNLVLCIMINLYPDLSVTAEEWGNHHENGAEG